eukprot:TRINITY_DN699_c1_g1_i1.p1 TRINITY_DN699_c1_g1~~TRINITY_DN699_c1_g1_i1.p1  ORF type:complete len:329 (+),score=59.95 TRINITY_DN699_c1_g1_i1:1290-2276(+)
MSSSSARAPAGGGAAGANLPGVSMKLKDLYRATNGFHDDEVLGEGSFGKVYRGELPDPAAPRSMWGGTSKEVPKLHVAIKKLDHESFQGYKEWLAEVLLLNKLRHPNLVRLMGYCQEKGEQLLVYELCPHGSLEDVLFRPGLDCVLNWDTRVEIALGACRGMAFLHKNNVIHRDFKTSNVLLAEDFSARVTDFGLAKAGPSGNKTHVSTRVLGTMGYLDPTYMETGRLTTKSDTFAFGVMLLELITGRPSMNGDGTLSLSTWMKPYLVQKRPDFRLFVDPRLGDRFSKAGIVKMAILAKYCIHDDPGKRPEMDVLVQNLEKVDRTEGS